MGRAMSIIGLITMKLQSHAGKHILRIRQRDLNVITQSWIECHFSCVMRFKVEKRATATSD